MPRPPFNFDYDPDLDDDEFDEDEYPYEWHGDRHPDPVEIPPHLVWVDPGTGRRYELYTRAIDDWESFIQRLEEGGSWRNH